MFGIKWPNGHMDKAPTWEALELHIMSSQWQNYETQEDFRRDMAQRAGYWSGIEIDIDGSSQSFLWELERTGMLTVVFLTNEVIGRQAHESSA